MLTASGPHHTNMGKRELRQMLTAMRRACGQRSTGPSGVAAQSVDSSSLPVSVAAAPPPIRSGCGEAGAGIELSVTA